MSSQPKLKKQPDNNSYYECEIMKAATLRSLNKSLTETDRSFFEAKCKLRLYSTFIKIIDCKTGIEEVFNLNRKSRIEWIWNNNEYKNNAGNFLGFILCLSLEPENKQEQEIMNLKQSLRSGFIMGTGGNQQNQTAKTQAMQVRNFSLKSLNYENSSTPGATDIENEQNLKIQAICYFNDTESRNHVIQYFKMRVIQRNFHSVYRAVRKLGKGSFASVYLVNLNDTDKHFAIKAFLKEKLIEEDKGYDSFYNEIMLMRCMKHKNILRLIEIWESVNSYYLIMPVCQGGSLLERIALTKKMEKSPQIAKEKDLAPIDSAFIKEFTKQMFEALLNLKQQGIMHRDIKPDNILLSSRHGIDPQIIDFGLGTFQNVENYIYPKCGTPGYVAPEIINMKDKNGRYDTQCDVFSLGAIFYFLLTLKPLFMGKVTKETIELNKRCQIDLNNPDMKHVDTTTKDLLKQMLAVNPENRITPEDALAHAYFQDNFLDEEDYDIPDDPITNIDQTLSRINDERPFDMQRINNHSTFNKLSSKMDYSQLSFNFLDQMMGKRECSLIGMSLVMKQPIARRNIGGKQISLEEVIVEEDQVVRPKTLNSHIRQESSVYGRLKHKGTLEQSDIEFADESHKLRVMYMMNKDKSTEDTEKEESYVRKNSKTQHNGNSILSSSNILKRVFTKDSIQSDTTKQSIIKKLSEEFNIK